MKGMVFVELLNMAENAVGEEMVDDVLDEYQTTSKGAFTAVGNYPCSDLMSLVGGFSEKTGISGDDLQTMFGSWMFERFSLGYPQFFEGKNDAFTMLESIEDEVHVEVRKLYPEVELPTFATERTPDGGFIMSYRSERPLVPFCKGMIEACLKHFGQEAQIVVKDFSESAEARADFIIKSAA
ncbi:MAG: heme NO-binding domain-containing protein [Pseudoruegeria sp.]